MLKTCSALAGLFAVFAALPTQAQKAPAAPKTHAELVQECMSDIQRGLKTGQTMTSHQRMQAEQQCKAYADSRK